MLHPVPLVPELRTKFAKRVDQWRVGPGKHPIRVFVLAAIVSAFIQSIGWMYFLNVFCMSGDDAGCTTKLDWSIWFLATVLFYLNAWAAAHMIADVSEKRRLKKLKPIFEARLGALDPKQLTRRADVAKELRDRGLDREREQPRAHFQYKLVGWFRNLFIVGSALPLFMVIDLVSEINSAVAISVIAAAQLYVVYKVTRHARKMRRIARELVEQWERDLLNLEKDVEVMAPVGAERIQYRPWARQRLRPTASPAAETTDR